MRLRRLGLLMASLVLLDVANRMLLQRRNALGFVFQDHLAPVLGFAGERMLWDALMLGAGAVFFLAMPGCLFWWCFRSEPYASWSSGRLVALVAVGVAGALSLGRAMLWIHGTRLLMPVTAILIDDGWGLVAWTSGTVILFAHTAVYALRQHRRRQPVREMERL